MFMKFSFIFGIWSLLASGCPGGTGGHLRKGPGGWPWVVPPNKKKPYHRNFPFSHNDLQSYQWEIVEHPKVIQGFVCIWSGNRPKSLGDRRKAWSYKMTFVDIPKAILRVSNHIKQSILKILRFWYVFVTILSPPGSTTCLEPNSVARVPNKNTPNNIFRHMCIYIYRAMLYDVV